MNLICPTAASCRQPQGVEFNAVNQEHSNYRHQVLLYSGSRPLSQAKLWCSAALRFRGAKARLRNLTQGNHAHWGQ